MRLRCEQRPPPPLLLRGFSNSNNRTKNIIPTANNKWKITKSDIAVATPFLNLFGLGAYVYPAIYVIRHYYIENVKPIHREIPVY